MAEDIRIRETDFSDLDDILSVERSAFGEEDEANLVKDLLNDPTAEPTLSLLAYNGKRAVGHILFTKCKLKDNDSISLMLLAPLAIVPDSQKRGIGGMLINEGLRILSERNVDLVFVLGHPEYYPRNGFKTAGSLGFEAPYPIPEKDKDAWMVQELRKGVIGSVSAKIICADMIDRPEYWRE